jgi:hypothetical protein
MVSRATCCAFAVALLGFSTAAQAGPRLYSGTISIHAFGNDTFGYYTAFPLGDFCNTVHNPFATTCYIATLRQGKPLAGSDTANVEGTSPASFQLNALGMKRTTSGSVLPAPPYPYSVTMATLANAAGSFRSGSGPGTFSIFKAPLGGRVLVMPGSNGFGGVMRLLGSAKAFGRYENSQLISIGTWNNLWSVIGGQSTALYGMRTASYTATFSLPNLMTSSTTMAYATGFPWTTGKVVVSARTGPFNTYFARTGYDNRTPMGSGTIQLVSPQLTHWTAAFHPPRTTGAIAIMRLHFVPEPGAWLLLAAGLGFLAVLYRVRTRRPTGRA